jgi:hypothetical protein
MRRDRRETLAALRAVGGRARHGMVASHAAQRSYAAASSRNSRSLLARPESSWQNRSVGVGPAPADFGKAGSGPTRNDLHPPNRQRFLVK